MPSVSGPQHRLMAAAAHDPEFAKRVGVPQSVGEDFVQADKAAGKHFAYGHHKQSGRNRYDGKVCTHENAHAFGKCPDVK